MEKNKALLINSCQICGSDRIHYRFISNGHPVCQCADCDLMFINPQPSEEALAGIHRAEGLSGGAPVQGTGAAAETLLQRALDYSGAARGKMLLAGRDRDAFAALARQKGFETAVLELPLKEEAPAGDFDLCVLLDAVGKVRNPVSLFSGVRSLLKPGGALLIASPSLDIWPARPVSGGWAGFQAGHLHYFNAQTIQNLLAKTGFGEVVVFRGNGASGRSGDGMTVLARSRPPAGDRTVSIVLPVYNEKATFGQLIGALAAKELRKEIIIVESNSTDGTREDVLKYKDAPGFKVILEDRPRGKGHAVRAGLKAATGEFVLIQDGDLEYDLNDYDELLEPLLKYQKAFVLGARHLKGWKMRHFNDQPLVSLILNFGQIFFVTLVNVFCGQNLIDPFTMYKVFRKDCVYGLVFKANRFDFDFELVIKLLRKGYIPLEIPVNYNSRSFKEGKKVSFFYDPLLWLVALVRFRFGPLYEKNRAGAPRP